MLALRMRKTRRTSRVGENVRDALVEVFRHDLKDIQLGWSSISDIEVSPDLHYAKVYVTGLKEEDAKETVEALRKAAPKIRHFLGQRIHLRYTPELDFRYDETAMRALRIETLISETAAEDAKRPKSEDDEEDPPSS
jgi:ribosome-binding factor A